MINCKSDLDATGPIQVCSCLSKCIWLGLMLLHVINSPHQIGCDTTKFVHQWIPST